MRSVAIAVFFLLCPIALFAKAPNSQTCKTIFTFTKVDALGNVSKVLSVEDQEWFWNKMAKKYPGICYVFPGSVREVFPSANPPKVNIVMRVTQNTYRGTRTVNNTSTTTQDVPTTGTVTDDYGQPIGRVEGTTTVQTDTTTSQEVPYSFEYPIFTLTLETPQSDGTWKVAHTFQIRGICPTFYGVCIANRKPTHTVFEEVLKWIEFSLPADQRIASN